MINLLQDNEAVAIVAHKQMTREPMGYSIQKLAIAS